MNRNRVSLLFHSTTQPLIDRLRRFMWKHWSIKKSKKSNKASRPNQHQRLFKRNKSDTKELVSLILAFINSKHQPSERNFHLLFHSVVLYTWPFSIPCFFLCHPNNPLHSPKKVSQIFHAEEKNQYSAIVKNQWEYWAQLCSSIFLANSGNSTETFTDKA